MSDDRMKVGALDWDASKGYLNLADGRPFTIGQENRQHILDTEREWFREGRSSWS